MFSRPRSRDEEKAGDFSTTFGGELKFSEEDLPAVAESASWVIEIDCDAQRRRLRIAIQPTKKVLAEYPIAEGFLLDQRLPPDEPAVTFQARIFERQNDTWPPAFRGVRVYFEGFRVLPYGDARDDWLDLDRDYRSRGKGELGRLRRLAQWELPEGHEKESLTQQGNNAFFGGVFLTKESATGLQMLVNREGFLPGPRFDFISDMVRLGIDLQVRLRYSVMSEVKQARRAVAEQQRRAAARASAQQAPSAFLVTDLQRGALVAIREARAAMAAGRPREASKKLKSAEAGIASAAELTDEAASEVTMYRVLASIGLEHAAFVHEVNSLTLAAQTVAQALRKLASQTLSSGSNPTLGARV